MKGLLRYALACMCLLLAYTVYIDAREARTKTVRRVRHRRPVSVGIGGGYYPGYVGYPYPAYYPYGGYPYWGGYYGGPGFGVNFAF
jgi:hypothetical protein